MSADPAVLIDAAAVEPAAPIGLHVLSPEAWAGFAAGGADIRFLGLFVARERVHALFERAGTLLFLATPLVDGRYPALSPRWPLAAWFERLARDLTGAIADGAADTRPAIRHGAAGTDSGWPRFIETRGEGYHQIGQGPVSGLIASPVHRRFTLDGGRIVRLEHRLGYAHRGILALMRGKSPRAAARFAARIAGGATVAHSLAFARATEAASGVSAPPRAEALRGIMLNIERITSDCSALAGTAEAAGRARLATALGRAREDIAAALAVGFGHRLMMDLVVPGGLAADVRPDGFPDLVSSLGSAARIARGIGRAGVQRDLGSAASLALARARSAIALAAAATDALAALPDGIIAHPLPMASGMAIGVADSAAGPIQHWIMLEAGQIAEAFVIDPAARLLPVLEAAAAGGDFDEFSLISQVYGLNIGAVDL
ncbi:MAG TPA: nickel-dependent hydrogenase large subunit [Acidiphilium sp.]